MSRYFHFNPEATYDQYVNDCYRACAAVPQMRKITNDRIETTSDRANSVCLDPDFRCSLESRQEGDEA